MHEGLIIENGVEIGGAGSNPLASAEKQCELLLIEIKALKELNKKLAYENGTLKRGREIQRLKIREQAEEMQKMEEQIQEEINYSASMSEALKDLQIRRG